MDVRDLPNKFASGLGILFHVMRSPQVREMLRHDSMFWTADLVRLGTDARI